MAAEGEEGERRERKQVTYTCQINHTKRPEERRDRGEVKL